MCACVCVCACACVGGGKNAGMERHGDDREGREREEEGKHHVECFACTPGGHGAHHTHSELEHPHPLGV